MLHIILGILKFIGIILAVILLLVTAVLLSVLFVPVRYRGDIRKTSDHTGVELKVSWLFHMLSFYVTYNLEQKKPLWTLRIFGVTLENLLKTLKKITGFPKKWKRQKHKKYQKHSIKNKDNKNKKHSKNKEEKKKASAVADSEEYEMEDLPVEFQEESNGESEKDSIEGFVEESKEDLMEEPEEESAAESEGSIEESTAESTGKSTGESVNGSSETAQGDLSEDPDHTEQNTVSKESKNRLKTIISKLADFFRKILSFITGIPEKLMNVRKSAEKKKEGIQSRVESIIDKIQYYLGLSETYEIKILLGDVCTELFHMLRHYVPGKIKGYIHFGTGDPALTGELTGLLYILIPARASQFRVEPEFTEKVFETELIMKGKIRVCHAVWLAWKLFRNKKLMRLIKELRKSR